MKRLKTNHKHRTTLLLFVALLALLVANPQKAYSQEKKCIISNLTGPLFEEGDMKPGDTVAKEIIVENVSTDQNPLDLEISVTLNRYHTNLSPEEDFALQEEFLKQLEVAITPQNSSVPIFGPTAFTNLLTTDGQAHSLGALDPGAANKYDFEVRFPSSVSDPIWENRTAKFDISLISGCENPELVTPTPTPTPAPSTSEQPTPTLTPVVLGEQATEIAKPLEGTVLGALLELPQTGTGGWLTLLSFLSIFLAPTVILVSRLYRSNRD